MTATLPNHTTDQPFQFFTASYLTRVENFKVETVSALHAGLAEAGDSTLFYHTFQTLGRYHFLTEGFSNDFAQWVQSSRNRPALAERLASLDVREYVSLDALRADLIKIVADYCHENQVDAVQPGFESFYFCETIEEQLPLGFEAYSLREFAEGLKKLPHASLQFHFLTSRLRLHLRSNDFSQWLEEELGLTELARRVNRIDVYANTLDSARDKIDKLIERELAA